MHSNQRACFTPPCRQGFTLIELLIVISIIVVLISLTSAGVMQMMEVQRQNNTETGLQTISEVLRKQWDKVIEDAKKETGLPQAVYDFAAGGNNSTARARVIWIKVRLMEAFPVSYAEVQNPFVYNATAGAPVYSGPLIPDGMKKYMPIYQELLGSKSSINAPTESAACLLMALANINRGGPKLDMERFNTADTDGDGMKELVDGWGTAYGFFRFPTGNSDLQNSNPVKSGPGATYCDLLDPDGTLADTTWPNQALFTSNIHPIFWGPGNTLPTVYTIPVLVSPAHNLQLGLDATMRVIDQNQANDNIYSYSLRQGGKS
jgi:prepilin-type N-terminal cleavage/methylation domain-containing protein